MIDIYCDGSFVEDHKIGGYAYFVMKPTSDGTECIDKKISVLKNVKNSNQMELDAIIDSLQWIVDHANELKHESVTIHSDYQSVITLLYNNKAIQKQFRKRKNQIQYLEISNLIVECQQLNILIEFEYIKSKSSINGYVDTFLRDTIRSKIPM